MFYGGRWRRRRYNSNVKHQHEVDDMAAAMEPVLYEFGVDLVFAGHVHAYERSHRILGCALRCARRHILVHRARVTLVPRVWRLTRE